MASVSPAVRYKAACDVNTERIRSVAPAPAVRRRGRTRHHAPATSCQLVHATESGLPNGEQKRLANRARSDTHSSADRLLRHHSRLQTPAIMTLLGIGLASPKTTPKTAFHRLL
jgi:hypothetical protein